MQLGTYYRYIRDNLGNDVMSQDELTAEMGAAFFCQIAAPDTSQTRRRCKVLGFEGMHFKWDRDQQKWYGPVSVKNLEALDRWPEAELSTEARQALDEFREAERKRREYYGRWI